MRRVAMTGRSLLHIDVHSTWPRDLRCVRIYVSSSLSSRAARGIAPIAVNNRCTSRNSRRRAAASPVSAARRSPDGCVWSVAAPHRPSAGLPPVRARMCSRSPSSDGSLPKRPRNSSVIAFSSQRQQLYVPVEPLGCAGLPSTGRGTPDGSSPSAGCASQAALQSPLLARGRPSHVPMPPPARQFPSRGRRSARSHGRATPRDVCTTNPHPAAHGPGAARGHPSP